MKLLRNSLATVEQLITYRKNEVLFSEEGVVLKRDIPCKDYEINVLKITDKRKKGLGYSAVPPPHPLIYNRPKKLDPPYSGLDEFKEPEFKGYGPENCEQECNVVCDKKSDDSKENSNESLVEKQVSQDTSSFVESSLNVDKETIFPVDKKVELAKPKNHEKPVKKSVSQDKYVAEILKKFNYTDVKSASTLVDLEKPLVKDGDANDVDVHLYRSMIGSLMYLTASRPDIMFAVYACARFQVTPKTSHLLAVKKFFRYLKGKPTLGLWLISWQCKKQTVFVTSTTEAEYVAAASYYG
ncbi:hypothetical protein Tco_1511585 [Tanacetum coccineum]